MLLGNGDRVIAILHQDAGRNGQRMLPTVFGEEEVGLRPVTPDANAPGEEFQPVVFKGWGGDADIFNAIPALPLFSYFRFMLSRSGFGASYDFFNTAHIISLAWAMCPTHPKLQAAMTICCNPPIKHAEALQS
jgi:hypothetical protein